MVSVMFPSIVRKASRLWDELFPSPFAVSSFFLSPPPSYTTKPISNSPLSLLSIKDYKCLPGIRES